MIPISGVPLILSVICSNVSIEEAFFINELRYFYIISHVQEKEHHKNKISNNNIFVSESTLKMKE